MSECQVIFIKSDLALLSIIVKSNWVEIIKISNQTRKPFNPFKFFQQVTYKISSANPTSPEHTLTNLALLASFFDYLRFTNTRVTCFTPFILLVLQKGWSGVSVISRISKVIDDNIIRSLYRIFTDLPFPELSTNYEPSINMNMTKYDATVHPKECFEQ
uniref:Uncharacterized protein n=1 Tax=Rhizophagus irregularis (strain DAOM 181602 / DAOM 197198 / MUCL 43194) TaxID=747089 RepID=U9U8W7_RHIID